MELRALPWVADGVEESEKEAAELLIAAARWYLDTFSALLEKPWVGDNITPAETDAIYGIRWAARSAPALAEQMLQKSWIQDEVSRDEATAIYYLYWTARLPDRAREPEAIEATLQILDMPFLEDVAGPDALAVRSLERLGDRSAEAFLEVMSHPTIADGITDEEAKIVTLLGGTYTYRPESVDVLLRGTGVYLEERVIELPLSGEVLLTIIRVRDQVTPSMDYLEHSVRTIEEFMGLPLPVSYIAYYFDDALRAAAGGSNFGTHIASKLRYDVVNGPVWWRTPSVIAHEVSHYYWRGNRDWIDEGPADLLGSISENRRVGTPIGVTNNPCAAAQTIGELEAMDPDALGTRGFNCNYSLGERLFLDLYNSLGEEAFRQAFRSLYLKSQAEDYSNDCEGTELGICHLVAAFKADVTEAQAAMVEEIVARWYGPLP